MNETIPPTVIEQRGIRIKIDGAKYSATEPARKGLRRLYAIESDHCAVGSLLVDCAYTEDEAKRFRLKPQAKSGNIPFEKECLIWAKWK